MYHEIPIDQPHQSGKTSILQVIFEQRNQFETISLESTTEIVPYNMYGGITVYDLPSQSYEEAYQNPELFSLLGLNTTIVFVLDIQVFHY
ncbi:hypothetical protein AYI70_g6067 [Smittium culicis]|uniref:Uncharacterized protein n=1 Tax=Smittium culicis TaxID=133412 RepID=A0A1R1XRL5_9FUNG|nr:hypothetical protein AYI70_g6067 [Smittium culicis]